ncbi:hypothetical protein JVU11DRAFT_9198 [Chiua virens]|nr:hypothetical protein JVU11DRAFT_9198 [Chiua virens]
MTATPKKTFSGPSNTSRAATANRTPGALRTTTTWPPLPKPSQGPNKSNKPPPFVVRTASPPKHLHTQHCVYLDATRACSASTDPHLPTHTPSDSVGSQERTSKKDHISKQKAKRNRRTTEHRKPSGGSTASSSDAIPPSPSLRLPHPNRTHNRTGHTLDPIRKRRTLRTSVPTHARNLSHRPTLHPHPRTSHRSPIRIAPSSSASALVSIPTKDGHLLEFDPLMTSPRTLDKLVGITDTAKKQAKDEIARLVKEAVREWAIE